MGRLSCTWCVCGRFCDAKRTLLQCLSDVFAMLNECVRGAFFQRKTDVFAVFLLRVQLVEGHFCLLNGASFVYLACLCTLLRGKNGRFCNVFSALIGKPQGSSLDTLDSSNLCLTELPGYAMPMTTNTVDEMCIKYNIAKYVQQTKIYDIR